MKKIINILIVMSSVFLVVLSGCSVETIGGGGRDNSDCPFGNVDCEYPGECGHYIDTDNNAICDHSEILE
jgi:hypothetical protein